MLRSERHRRAARPAPARGGWTRPDTAAGHGWRSAPEPSGARLPPTRPPRPISRSALDERPAAPARGPEGKDGPARPPPADAPQGEDAGEVEGKGNPARGRTPPALTGAGATCAPRPLSLNSGTVAQIGRAHV